MKGIEIDFEERCSEEYDRKEKRLMHVGKRIIFFQFRRYNIGY